MTDRELAHLLQPWPNGKDPYADVPPPDEPENEGPARQHLRDRLLSVSQLRTLPPVRPLVDGLLYRNTVAQLSATAGSYKSFAAVGVACAVALGMNWEGHHVPQSEKVVYVAAEGASGLEVRILAWCETTGVDPADLDGRLYVLPCPIQLGNVLDVSDAQELAAEVGAGLVIIDTRAKCTLGMDENSATEQGRAIAAAEKIQAAAGCTVLVIHHAGRSGSTPRGSTAWDGAVWSDLRMEGGDLVAKIHCEKHKDAPSGCDHQYRLVPHTVSDRLMAGVEEEHRKTLVFVQNDGWTSQASNTKSDHAVLDIIWTSATAEGLTGSQIITLAEERGVKRSTAYAALKRLVDAASLRNIGTEKRARYIVTTTGRAALGVS